MHGRHHPLPDVPDIGWFRRDGTPMGMEQWNDGAFHLLGVRRACGLPGGEVDVTYMLLNASGGPITAVLPGPAWQWTLLVDTTRPEEPQAVLDEDTCDIVVPARGLLLLSLTPHAPATTAGGEEGEA